MIRISLDIVSQMGDAIDKLSDLYAKAVYQAGENFEGANIGKDTEISESRNSDRVGKSKKSVYNEFNSLSMQWAFSTKTKVGDRTILYDSRKKEYVLIRATKEDVGFERISVGSYEQMEVLNEAIADRKTVAFDRWVESSKVGQRYNIGNNVNAQNGRRSSGDDGIYRNGVQKNKNRADGTADIGEVRGNSDENGQIKRSDRDSRYLELAKNPEANKAELQRMVEDAAKENGYIPVTRYHQTGTRFTKFKNNNPIAGLNDSETPNGYFFKTNDHDIGVGDDFVKTGHGGNIQMPVYLSSEFMLHFKDRQDAVSWYRDNIEGYKELNDKLNDHKQRFEKFSKNNTAKMFEELNALQDAEQGVYDERISNAENEIVSKYDKILDDYGLSVEKEETELRKSLRNLLNKYFLDGTSEYDGIELEDDGHRYIDGKRENVHTFIVFDSNQVKSADPVTYDDNGNVIPISERFDTDSEDIRYSDRDSDGDELSSEQQKFFKDSKVRDEDGNLRVVYHGTEADFTVFDSTKSRANMDIQGNFFSPWEIDAGGYGSKVNAYYLNIKNPASEGIGYKALNKFKGQNNVGVKAREYLISLGYDGVNNGDEEYIAFYPEQIKRIDNKKPTENVDVRYSDRDYERYSYDELVSKQDMVLTHVSSPKKTNRADIIANAKKNAAKIGKTRGDGSVVVTIKDTNVDVLIGTNGLKHGLTRSDLAEKAVVLEQIGNILHNSIKINESIPKIEISDKSYVLIGCAVDSNNNKYIVRSVVNTFSNQLESIDVLYAVNAKKESAVLNAPRLSRASTDSVISIAELLDFVNTYFPENLSEDVLRRYGHTERPVGNPRDLGESMLYSERDADATDKKKETSAEYLKRVKAEYRTDTQKRVAQTKLKYQEKLAEQKTEYQERLFSMDVYPADFRFLILKIQKKSRNFSVTGFFL